MSVQNVKDVFAREILPFGNALDGIYAAGGLMAHHDGVNSAVESFWVAAEGAVASGLSEGDKSELEGMYARILNLTCNAHTRPEVIVGYQRYENLVNAL